MAIVHILKANKDYPDIEVKKGETYYKWSTRVTVGKSYVSRTHRSKTPPSRAQLTSSEFYSAIYSAFDDTSISTPDDVRDLAGVVREIGDEQQEKLDNMPEGLQQGATGELLQERVSACEDSATSLEELADEWESAEEDHEKDQEEEREAFDAEQDQMEAQHKEDARVNGEEPGPFERDEYEPEEFDSSEFADRVSECEPQV